MEASSFPAPLSRSNKYFYANGDCFVKVDSTVYRIHFYHLRESTHFFDDSLRIRDDDTALIPNSPGSDEQNLLIIEDVLKQDFEALLWFFYESQYIWTYGVVHCQARWESILLLAEKFAMPSVAKVACRALALADTIDDVLRVALANKFGMGRAWALDSLRRIVSREQAISEQEAILLGYSMAASLAQAREAVLPIREPCAAPVCSVSLQPCLCYHGVHVCTLTGCTYAHDPRLPPMSNRVRASGDLFCKVIDDVVFRIHSHHFTRSSDVFSAMLSLPPENASSRKEGSHEENPIILPGVSLKDFQSLVGFFYRGPYIWSAAVKLASSRWESILRLADKLDMKDICKVAIHALGESSSVLGDVRKISLFTQFDLDKAFLLNQLKNVCRRADGLTVEEACDVGLIMGTLIARAREALLKRAFAARRVLEATDEEAEEVVKEVILAAYSS
ncbi:hypothetical protein GGG16DRAFT_44862 [Schizophyllum commune]